MPDELVGEVLQDLKKRFHAVSVETQTIRGMWEHEGKDFRDDLFRVYVDVPDVPESRQFFIELKERLKTKFEQLDIWMTTHPIEVL